MSSHRLIWSADDFGYSGPINEGIALGHRQGRLTGASILAGGAAFEGAARLAREMPELDLGVHLAAVEMPAVLAPRDLPGLSDERGLLPLSHRQFLVLYLTGRISPAVVAREWEAQIARVRDLGLRPNYLDSHQHLHVLPGLFEAVLGLMKRFEIRAVRIPSDAVPGRAGLVRRGMLGFLFQLGARARALARREGHATPDGTLGIAEAGSLCSARIAQLAQGLAGRPHGTWELVLHPGFGEPAGSEASAWGYHWADELEATRDAILHEKLRRAGVGQTSYRELILGYAAGKA